MDIDKNAPLSASAETLIPEPVEKVWAALTEIDNWPQWQPDVSSAHLDGSLSTGTVFRWKAKGLDITSTIQELASKQRIAWTGNSIGMQAIHIWTLKAESNNTRVITQESLSGWFPRLLKFFDPAFLEKSLLASLKVLKARSAQ